MSDARIRCAITLLACVGITAAQSQTPDVQQIADTMVRLCIGGGTTQAVAGTATGGADLSLRSLDVKGNLAGEFKISRSSAEGLSHGIDNALTQVAADQADKVRDCLKPVRDRLIDVLLPIPRTSVPTPNSVTTHGPQSPVIQGTTGDVRIDFNTSPPVNASPPVPK
jgi:hypothetical protein